MLALAFGMMLVNSAVDTDLNTIEVFHKNMPPSLQTLEQVELVLADFADEYEISFHLITDTASAELIEQYGLPETHFPFAVVVNGQFSALVDGNRTDFVHFPLLMHGIGRHEGNWSMEHLRRVLEDNTLLLVESALPEIDESGETGCME